MEDLNKIADDLRTTASKLDKIALSDFINRETIEPAELCELIKQKANGGNSPGLLQRVSDLLFDRYEVARVRQLTTAQSTELAAIIGVTASTTSKKEKKK